MDHLNKGDKVLLVWRSSDTTVVTKFVGEISNKIGEGNIKIKNYSKIENPLNSNEQSIYDVILFNLLPPPSYEVDNDALRFLMCMLKPGGKFVYCNEKYNDTLILNGFINLTRKDDTYICYKPDYEVGSSLALVLKNKIDVVKAWNIDNDDDMIDSDVLLDENDKQKAVPAPLKVCGTTGVRKACADCSCGLAEELKGEVKETPKSSCGSCYLGDAFRCASCPYLGMPSFKPGEKVMLDDLKPDI